ncbi:phosphotransferase [Occultella glacieicola]|uniref:phosphotransferase n=1 Tax=Occultella glacieicola TaxID=2518684 RepID=UPI001F1EEA7E|nr:phosphotransferase [Occultella glacieicola]
MSDSNPSRSPLALAALATVALPGLDVVATRPPRTPGADFDVVGVMDATGSRWIVRSPRDAAAGAALEGEVALLEALGRASDDGLLTFEVPEPAGFAPLPEGGRAMVYPELRGKPLPIERLAAGPGLAAQVGRAIASLHELPESVVADAGLPTYDADAYRARRLAEVDEAAATGHIPAGLLRRWEHALEDVTLWRFRATPVHGDLAAEHVLVDDDDVVAILDWSDARVADPADDLAWLLAAAPEESLDAILEAYALARTERADEHLAARALLASELAVARWLMHGVRHRDGAIIDDAVQMLRELDEEVADLAPIGYAEPVVADVTPLGDDDAADGWDEDEPDGWDEAADDDEDDEDAEEEHPDHADGDLEWSSAAVVAPSHRAGELTGDDSDTAEHPVVADSGEFQVPDYRRGRPRRGFDDTPTAEFPPQAP